ncbi:ribosomal protein L40E [Paenibacillus sp. DS2015]
MNCLKCNFENSHTAKFCDRCGILLYASFKAQLRNNESRMERNIAVLPTEKKRDLTSKYLLIPVLVVGIFLLIIILYD